MCSWNLLKGEKEYIFFQIEYVVSYLVIEVTHNKKRESFLLCCLIFYLFFFLSFLEKPSVTLSEKCNGMVKINGLEVCNTNWDHSYSQLVCQEQMCSNAIADAATLRDPKPDAVYNHVFCEDFHFELGQCKRYKGKCGGKLVSVSCVSKCLCTLCLYCQWWIQLNHCANLSEEMLLSYFI